MSLILLQFISLTWTHIWLHTVTYCSFTAKWIFIVKKWKRSSAPNWSTGIFKIQTICPLVADVFKYFFWKISEKNYTDIRCIIIDFFPVLKYKLRCTEWLNKSFTAQSTIYILYNFFFEWVVWEYWYVWVKLYVTCKFSELVKPVFNQWQTNAEEY